jgi:hypothetical protein
VLFSQISFQLACPEALQDGRLTIGFDFFLASNQLEGL